MTPPSTWAPATAVGAVEITTTSPSQAEPSAANARITRTDFIRVLQPAGSYAGATLEGGKSSRRRDSPRAGGSEMRPHYEGADAAASAVSRACSTSECGSI